MCRIKYCDKLTVSKCNSAGRILKTETFESADEMKKALKATCQNNTPNIEMVDIGFPVKILKVNDFLTCYNRTQNYDEL